jgi:hypothetical protein
MYHEKHEFAQIFQNSKESNTVSQNNIATAHKTPMLLQVRQRT